MGLPRRAPSAGARAAALCCALALLLGPAAAACPYARVRPGDLPSPHGSRGAGAGAHDLAGPAPPRRRSRTLLQAPADSECVVDVGGGERRRFAACLPVPKVGDGLVLHWTAAPNPANASETLLDMALSAAEAGGEYLSVGFANPKWPGKMEWAPAFIVKDCDGCETGADAYQVYMKGTKQEDVVAESRLPAGGFLAGAAPGAQLAGAWSVRYPRPLAELTAVNMIFAAGPLGRVDGEAGVPIEHKTDGDLDVDLTAGTGTVTAAADAAAPAAAPAAAAAAAPAAAAAAPAAAEAVKEVPPAVPAAPKAGAKAGAAAAALGDCGVELAGERRVFDSCLAVRGVGSQFTLHWTAAAADDDPGATRLDVAMAGHAPGGYVSVGFPTEAGEMKDASAVILKACGSCASGAEIYEVWMSGTDQEDVNPDGRLGAAALAAAATPSGHLTGAFSVRIAKPLAELTDTDLIFAAGPVRGADDEPQEHRQDGKAVVDLAAPGAAGAPVEAENTYSTAAMVHMVLMALSWGILIPAGVVSARSFRASGAKPAAAAGSFFGAAPPAPAAGPAAWFRVHRGVQSAALLFALAGVISGFVSAGGWDVDEPALIIHRDLGVTVMCLGVAQVTALLYRPALGTRPRAVWTPAHKLLGYAAAVLAVATIYQGIVDVAELGAWAWICYTLVLIIIAGVGAGKEVSDARVARAAAAGALYGAEGGAAGAPPPAATKSGRPSLLGTAQRSDSSLAIE
jgi:hypothetical protein